MHTRDTSQPNQTEAPLHCYSRSFTTAWANRQRSSVAGLADMLVKSPRKFIILMIAKKIVGFNYPKNVLFNFENKITAMQLFNTVVDRDAIVKEPVLLFSKLN